MHSTPMPCICASFIQPTRLSSLWDIIDMNKGKGWRNRFVVQVRVVPCASACLDWSRIPGERSWVCWEGEGAEPSLPWFMHIPIWFCKKGHIALLLHPSFLPGPFFLLFSAFLVCMYTCLFVWVHKGATTEAFTSHKRIEDLFGENRLFASGFMYV